MYFIIPFLLLLVKISRAQTPTSSSIILSGSNALGSSIPYFGGDLVPTGSGVSYISYSTTSSINGSIPLLEATLAVANGSTSPTSSHSTSSTSFSLLQGSVGASTTTSLNSTASGNSTATRTTSSSATPTNTQPCNNYPEFCDRKYSNITYVAAHNSPFVNPNNAASNQELGVIDQLNDGIRMLQGQTHYNATTNTISYCHTSCDLLNAGTAESYFTDVTNWIRAHPYDVVTILIGNSDLIAVGNYSAPLEQSGLSKYAYVPPQVPMNISSWPTLASMILMGKRAVIFMDYNANQTEVPYILDEFSQMWETPFSPTNRSFPCTQQRPPGLSTKDAEQRMYMANHNLNTEISLEGSSLLIPTTTLINQTNAVNGTGSLGLMANDCAGTDPPHLSEAKSLLIMVPADWIRPPNFLLVDYYNLGSFPGSVFEVAAQQNNVTYNRPCCGIVPSLASLEKSFKPMLPITGFTMFLLWIMS
ncbi:hypothetical protein ACLMJK_007244 [Lecanora helva]